MVECVKAYFDRSINLHSAVRTSLYRRHDEGEVREQTPSTRPKADTLTVSALYRVYIVCRHQYIPVRRYIMAHLTNQRERGREVGRGWLTHKSASNKQQQNKQLCNVKVTASPPTAAAINNLGIWGWTEGGRVYSTTSRYICKLVFPSIVLV